jgi:hypothetical protein
MHVTNRQVSGKVWGEIERGYKTAGCVKLNDRWWIVRAIELKIGVKGMILVASLIEAANSLH